MGSCGCCPGCRPRKQQSFHLLLFIKKKKVVFIKSDRFVSDYNAWYYGSQKKAGRHMKINNFSCKNCEDREIRRIYRLLAVLHQWPRKKSHCTVCPVRSQQLHSCCLSSVISFKRWPSSIVLYLAWHHRRRDRQTIGRIDSVSRPKQETGWESLSKIVG